MAQVGSAENAKLMFETIPEFQDWTKLTDDGDNQTFTSGDGLWSGQSEYEAEVRPNGLLTGGDITPGSSDDTVDVAALTCWLAGELTSVSAESGFAVTRPTGDNAKISSIIINSSGAVAEVEGAEATGTTFSSERGAGGGPPWIPTGSIKIGQVHMTSSTAAVFTSDQIKQVPNTHKELADFPTWDVNMLDGQVEFNAALPTIHSDDDGSTEETKEVYATYYSAEDAMVEQPYAYDFVPPVNSHSVSSTQVYGATVGSRSTSLGQGSFESMMKDNATDMILGYVDKVLWFKFFPDRNKSPYVLCQGKLGFTPANPASGNQTASFTISSTEASERKSS
jgi:hypothetical protein